MALAATEKDTAAHILLIHAEKLARIVLRAHHVCVSISAVLYAELMPACAHG
eukprot:COSAG02_NODE_29344_length_571_cov_0.692797_1_plen_51_part_10